jgi:type IX secretion system PorP/SprF family membrane protein
MITIKKIGLLLTGCFLFAILPAQQIPSKPSSYPVFTPLILNPGIAGSKDFSRVELVSRVNGSQGAQMLTYHTRLQNSGTTGTASFSNFGVGGYLFHDRLSRSRNLGAGVSGAYHIPLGKAKVSGLSIGLSLHALYNMGTENQETNLPNTNTLDPNADLGIYYYGPRGFIGLSSVNLLSLAADSVPVISNELSFPNENLLYGGFRMVLSREREIVLEPSVIVQLHDSVFSDIEANVTPILKLYVQNACFGTYFRSFDELAFFLQYQFPRFYAGVNAAFPRNQMLISNDQLTIEVAFGLNLGTTNRSTTLPYRW